MSRYSIAPEAVQDLDEIGNYFLSRNVEVGERWFQAFNQKCQQLVQFPMMGRSYFNIRSDLRGVPLAGFVILYRVAGDRIEIYENRQWQTQFRCFVFGRKRVSVFLMSSH